ncbi:hypothetical protein [Rhodococcus jostii]|uniref:hypothetical protein n=1 Tax=Rhodococcus jostii TaxID=132919 RepID=UPI0036357C48
MAEIVLFPDILAAATAFLNAEFAARGDTARAATKVPKTRPARYVRLDLGGGIERNRITGEPLLIIQASAADEPAAYALCELARALIRSMPERDTIAGASVMGCTSSSLPVPFPDPDLSTPRYQATVGLLISPA